jgi:hypothetical protein
VPSRPQPTHPRLIRHTHTHTHTHTTHITHTSFSSVPRRLAPWAATTTAAPSARRERMVFIVVVGIACGCRSASCLSGGVVCGGRVVWGVGGGVSEFPVEYKATVFPIGGWLRVAAAQRTRAAAKKRMRPAASGNIIRIRPGQANSSPASSSWNQSSTVEGLVINSQQIGRCWQAPTSVLWLPNIRSIFSINQSIDRSRAPFLSQGGGGRIES